MWFLAETSDFYTSTFRSRLVRLPDNRVDFYFGRLNHGKNWHFLTVEI